MNKPARPLTRPWLVRYYASGNLGVDNWSSQGFAKNITNAKRGGVVHLIVEHWSCARIFSRVTNKQVCVLTRTSMGITVKEVSE